MGEFKQVFAANSDQKRWVTRLPIISPGNGNETLSFWLDWIDSSRRFRQNGSIREVT